MIDLPMGNPYPCKNFVYLSILHNILPILAEEGVHTCNLCMRHSTNHYGFTFTQRHIACAMHTCTIILALLPTSLGGDIDTVCYHINA